MTGTFTLDPRLKSETLEICDWELCRVLRMNDRSYPWLVLVPRHDAARDVIDLSTEDQALLWVEVARAAELLKKDTNAHKLNIAALGNVVAQLHVHVIARFRDDPAWPKPIWGVRPVEPIAPAEIESEIARWRNLLASA